EVADRGAGDREHHRGRVPEFTLKLDGARARRELAVQRLQFEIDVAELLPAVARRIGQLHRDEGCTWQGERANAPGVRSRRINGLVLGDRLFDRPRDQLFYLLGVRAWPLTRGDRDPYRDIRVLPLRHGGVAIHAPRKDRQETCPGDLPVLHEKPRRVVDVLDEFSVALVCHGYRYGRTRTS